MRVQVMRGAIVTLAAGVLAAGCYETGPIVLPGEGPGGDLVNGNGFPARSVAASNLASDGGGLSPSGQHVVECVVQVNDDAPSSDGPFAGDRTAMVLFRTFDGVARHRLYACRYRAGELTPPVAISGDDLDESVATDLHAAVMIPLNTRSYGEGQPLTPAMADVRAADGDWVLLWTGRTHSQHPLLAVSQQSNVPGVRRALYMTWFHGAHSGEGLATVDRGGVARTASYGFELVAEQVSTVTSGGSPGATGGAAGTFVPPQGVAAPGGGHLMPPAHITSFGVVSDGLAREARFGGDALPLHGSVTRTVRTGSLADAGVGPNVITLAGHGLRVGEYVDVTTLLRRGAAQVLATPTPNTFLVDFTTGIAGTVSADVGPVPCSGTSGSGFSRAVPNLLTSGGISLGTGLTVPPGLALLDQPLYRAGEAVTFLGVVFTQVVNSTDGGGSFVNASNTAAGGEELALFVRPVDLARKTLGAQTRLDTRVPAARNTAPTNQPGTAPFPELRVYNGHLFFRYADASLVTASADFPDADLLGLLQPQVVQGEGGSFRYDDTGGARGGPLNGAAFHEELIAHLHFAAAPALDGTLQLGAAVQDLSLVGAQGVHGLADPSSSGLGAANPHATADLAPDREIQRFDEGLDRSVFGTDEGLADTVIFYVSADNTNTASSPNMDRGLVAAGFDPLSGAFLPAAAGKNPLALTDPTQSEDWARQQAGRVATDQRNSRFAGAIDAVNVRGAVGRTSLQDPLVEINSDTANGRGGATYRTGAFELFRTVINRTGEWIGVAWLMDVGVSTDLRQAAHLLVYQTLRPLPATTGTSGAAPPAVAPPFEARFSALDKGATEFSARDASVALVPPGPVFDAFSRLDVAETPEVWSHLPVNAIRWQDRVDYRTGVQADADRIFVLWEQSDATEDRLFARRLDVARGASGTPTVTLQPIVELEGTPSVPGQANYNPLPGTTVAAPRSTFRFIDRNLDFGLSPVQTIDGGRDGSGAGGSLLVLFNKVVDNTGVPFGLQPRLAGLGGDGDAAQRDLILVELSGGAQTGRVAHAIAEAREELSVRAHATVLAGPGGARLRAEGGQVDSLVSANLSPPVENLALVPAGLGLRPGRIETDIAQHPGFTPDAVYLFGLAPTGHGGVFGGRGLRTRHLDLGARAGAAAPALGLRLTPPAEPGPDYQPALAIDGSDRGRVIVESVLQAGSRLLYFYEEDGHAWAQETFDGLSYRTADGAPAPYLVDESSSANVGGWISVPVCRADGTEIEDALVLFLKPDLYGWVRLYARAGIR